MFSKKAIYLGVAVVALAGYGHFHGNTHNYPDNYHRTYMDACTTKARDYPNNLSPTAADTACQCNFDYLEAHYTLREIDKLEQQAESANAKGKDVNDWPREAKAAVTAANAACAPVLVK